MMDGMPGAGLWIVLWGLFVLALLVLVILGIVWLVRNLVSGSGGGRSDGDGAEEILRRRYASGEISREEYHRLREDLRSG